MTTPQPLPQSARRAGTSLGTNYDVASSSVQTADTFNAGLSRDSATTPPPDVAAERAGSSLPSGFGCDREHEHSAGRQFIHSSPCGCVDDAQRHYALIARDLIAAGRDGELTDDMRQAYDYEFGGVQEPEPPQIPEF